MIPAAWLRDYRRSWLRADLVGGLSAGLVVVPQAMAYATIADLPPEVGLYTCMVPMAEGRFHRTVDEAVTAFRRRRAGTPPTDESSPATPSPFGGAGDGPS